VASREALDSAVWGNEDADALRIADDEAIVIGTTHVSIGDADAIVEQESGYVFAVLGSYDVDAIAAHTDWAIPEEPGAVAQGKLAGVPVKLAIGEPTILVVQAAYADELQRRLGW
jgi:hypothetical protein